MMNLTFSYSIESLIKNQINSELARLGYISRDVDYEALELLLEEMDAGRILLVPTM